MSCIQIPNGLGALSGVAQLSLYAFYRNATPRPDIDTNEKGNPVKTADPNSIYVEMPEKNSALPKHEANNGAP